MLILSSFFTSFQAEERLNHLKIELDMLRNKNEDLSVQLEKYQQNPPASTTSATEDGGQPGKPSAETNGSDQAGDNSVDGGSLKALRVELSQADDRLREVQAAMTETQAELQRARQRERLNEDHSARLTATVSW